MSMRILAVLPGSEGDLLPDSFVFFPYAMSLLVAAGVIPLVVSLIILDGAFAYVDETHMHWAGIWMFICVGCDFPAGLLALIVRYFRRY